MYVLGKWGIHNVGGQADYAAGVVVWAKRRNALKNGIS